MSMQPYGAGGAEPQAGAGPASAPYQQPYGSGAYGPGAYGQPAGGPQPSAPYAQPSAYGQPAYAQVPYAAPSAPYAQAPYGQPAPYGQGPYAAPQPYAPYGRAPVPYAALKPFDPVAAASTLQLNYWLSALFGILPALIFYVTEKDKHPLLDAHLKEILNLCITRLVLVPLVVVPFVGWLLFMLGQVALLVVGIVGASQGCDMFRRGMPYRFPVVIRFLT